MDARNDLYRGGGDGYDSQQSLKLKYANRHDLIAGATGTGKTVTLKIMAEEFLAVGVPVFLSDVKSDLAGDLMQREFVTARRYSGTRVGRSRRVGVEDVGSALGQALVKELSCTTGRCIIRGVLGGFSRDAE